MNTTSRYRTRLFSPWLIDIATGLGFIAATVATMWIFSHLPAACTAIGFCTDSIERTSP